jgi:hypothetical protein
VNVYRDVIERLDRLGVRYYITGSEALARYAEPRMSRDMDLVIGLDRFEYERRLRPAFEDAYLVADLATWGDRAMGSLLHIEEIVKVDLALGRSDPWSKAAMERRLRIDDPIVGPAWFISPEDLILAKLDWSDGGRSELQMRDCRSLARITPDLDRAYLRLHGQALGVSALLEDILGD